MTKTHELFVGNGYVFIVKLPNDTQQSLVYLSAPASRNFVILHSSLTDLEYSELLKDLCQSFQIYRQRVALWKCHRNDYGRLSTSCCRAWLSLKCIWTGQRTKPSRRTRFTTCVMTFPPSYTNNTEIANRIKEQLSGHVLSEFSTMQSLNFKPSTSTIVDIQYRMRNRNKTC